uniref:CSP14 n=1 Tax=Holotrichia parallela TaxID=93412 RepID=A0A0G2YDB1_HOLPA|nr:CSP14 [Holotrichia parallela]
MKIFALLFIFVSVSSVLAEERYTTKYDNIKLNEILKNKRLVRGYGNCLLNKGVCSTEGAELKEHMHDIIETGCSKCNVKQRNGFAIILRHLIDKEPKMWMELEEIYDPDGTYRLKYKEEANKEGIKL